MKSNEILYLSRKDVEAVGLSMAEMIAAVEEMFLQKGKGETEMPPKPGIHTRPNAFIHAMPAHIPALSAAGMKWVSGYPENPQKGLPYICGLLILNDPETGVPLGVMDCTWITAMRTGAATAVAAKYLAKKESSRLGIIACGVQGRSNLEALSCIFSIRCVRAYDLYPEKAREFAEEMGNKFGIEIEPVSSPQEAVRDADLVVTSGPILKKPAPVIEASWLKRGGFGCALDFDSYWKGEAMRFTDKIVTDDLGQLEYYRKEGYFQDTPSAFADLGEVIVGKKPGRQTNEEYILAIHLGLALSDVAVGIRIYRKALDQGIGTVLPL